MVFDLAALWPNTLSITAAADRVLVDVYHGNLIPDDDNYENDEMHT